MVRSLGREEYGTEEAFWAGRSGFAFLAPPYATRLSYGYGICGILWAGYGKMSSRAPW